MRTVIDLAEIDASMIDLVGGKAAGLGELIRSGERVPDGFCLTVEAFRDAGNASGEIPAAVRTELVQAYARLGGGQVAVRSSATTEDLPYASFAGQHETLLNVAGPAAVAAAVMTCWSSLWTQRAASYQQVAGIGHGVAKMAVVVQRMIDPAVAGVLFTANPVTGTRGQMVVDAAPGLGTTVVNGSGGADHYVLDHQQASITQAGCLDGAHLRELRATGLRLQKHFGSPQDIEWAIDSGGTLWLLQSRPITTLFPLPSAIRPRPPLSRVYISNGSVQGMLRPFTPMGMCAMKMASAAMLQVAGFAADPIGGPAGHLDLAGREFFDVTGVLRSKAARTYLGEGWLGGPDGVAVLDRLLADPQLPRGPVRLARLRLVGALVLRAAPAGIPGMARALIRPATARATALDAGREIERKTTAPEGVAAPQRLHFVETAHRAVMGRAMGGLLWPVIAGLMAARASAGLLKGITEDGEVETTLRGVPYNVTVQMNLDLWHLASAASGHRDLLVDTAPAELAARYLDGELPDIGLGAFLDAYGRRAVAEIDLGVPRWAEDPAPVFAMIANCLRVTDPGQAPDQRFAAAAAEAEAKIGELVRRARRTRPVRGFAAGFMLRRARDLSGVRELPKFVWLHALGQMREQLLLIGAELAASGLLDRADDVMFLDISEVRGLLAGTRGTARELVAARREIYRRELRRRYVPRILLSDGTDPETVTRAVAAGHGQLVGIAAAPGKVTGAARVILDPVADAHLEPGEILVTRTTDPGWTPLFLVAGGLVTEMGTPIAHGPTVAREYGIPAVVGVHDVTGLIRTGDLITVDGSTGVVMRLGCPAGRAEPVRAGPQVRPDLAPGQSGPG